MAQDPTGQRVWWNPEDMHPGILVHCLTIEAVPDIHA